MTSLLPTTFISLLPSGSVYEVSLKFSVSCCVFERAIYYLCLVFIALTTPHNYRQLTYAVLYKFLNAGP